MFKHKGDGRTLYAAELLTLQLLIFIVAPCILKFTELLCTNECNVTYYISLKFTLKCLKTPTCFDP
jgi:hypothetical protein